jgi:hypothetical protein
MLMCCKLKHEHSTLYNSYTWRDVGSLIYKFDTNVEMGGPCNTNVEKRNAYRLLVEKTEGKRPLGRPRHRWVDNIRMDLGVVGWGDVDWIGLAQDKNRWRVLMNSVLNLRVP